MVDLGRRPVLVIGGAGFIGRHVVTQLLRSGFEVRVLDVVGNESIVNAADNHKLHWMVGSTEDEVTIADAARSCDSAIFLANTSLPATSNLSLSTEIYSHVCSTLRVAEICEAQGVNHFVFPSSGGTVYGGDSMSPLTEESTTLPRNAYGVSKLSIEHYLRILALTRGMRTLSLRISNPYGEGQSARRGQGFVAAAMEHVYGGRPLLIWGDGSTVRDFIYVGDVADAIVRAISYEGKAAVLNVGSGTGHSLNQIMEKVEFVTGYQIRAKMDKSRTIDVRANVLGISAAQKELGWRPLTSIDDGLARTAAWWCDQMNIDRPQSLNGRSNRSNDA